MDGITWANNVVYRAPGADLDTVFSLNTQEDPVTFHNYYYISLCSRLVVSLSFCLPSFRLFSECLRVPWTRLARICRVCTTTNISTDLLDSEVMRYVHPPPPAEVERIASCFPLLSLRFTSSLAVLRNMTTGTTS